MKTIINLLIIAIIVYLLYKFVYLRYFSMDMTFSKVTDLVIDNLEGGYYHPDMLHDGRLRYDPRLETSGETMFGLDRINGAGLAVYPNWDKFWGLIDKADARHKWKWNYKGGDLEKQLKAYASDIMKGWYEKLAKDYLSPKAKSIVDSDKGLLFHFAYASWNGAGWFKIFAAPINAAVINGTTNPKDLEQIAIDQRKNSTNSLIVQSSGKIENIMKTA